MSTPRSTALDAARDMLGLSVLKLWFDYMALSGSLAPQTIQAFLAGDHDVGDHDHDVLVQALNENFMDRGEDHPLVYTDEMDDTDR